MKKSIAPLVLMMIFSLILALSATAQRTITATAHVTETSVYDYDLNKYVSSKDGKVDNNYTHAKISEKGHIMTFVLNKSDNTSVVTQYRVVERKRNGNVIIAKRVGDNSQIKIVQRKHSLDVMCDFQKDANRYDAAIVFTNLRFN